MLILVRRALSVLRYWASFIPIARAIRFACRITSSLEALTEGSHLASRDTDSPASRAAKSAASCFLISCSTLPSQVVPIKASRSS